VLAKFKQSSEKLLVESIMLARRMRGDSLDDFGCEESGDLGFTRGLLCGLRSSILLSKKSTFIKSEPILVASFPFTCIVKGMDLIIEESIGAFVLIWGPS